MKKKPNKKNLIKSAKTVQKNSPKNKPTKPTNTILNSKPYRIGIVTARFNEEVTSKLEQGALEFFEKIHSSVEILNVKVPGAVEIPLACMALLDLNCDGVVALGAVIRGETSHYDYVCNSVERGISELMLDYKRPIGFGVLTVENEEQAMDRCGGKHGNKGYEAAQVTMEMIGLLDDLEKFDN